MLFERKNRRSLVLGSCILLVVILANYSCSTRRDFREGRVIDAVSGTAVADAVVTLYCITRKPWHGHNATTFTTKSLAPDGVFQFDKKPSDLQHCNYINVIATKVAYVPNNIRLTQISEKETNPKIVYIIKENDLPMLELKALLREIPRVGVDSADAAEFNFSVTYRSFMQSRIVAVNPELQAWVRDKYCMRLHDAYAKVPVDEREKFDKNYGEGMHLTPSSYDLQIAPFCNH